MKKRILSALAVIAVCGVSIAQENAKKAASWCVTDEQTQLLEQQNPNILEQRAQLEEWISNFATTYDPATNKATIIIPTVVHNITHGDNQGYVSKAQIENQIATLNNDFKRLNLDASSTRPQFAPYAATLDVEFRLARKDPNGNCTEGITRHVNSLSYNPNPRDQVKTIEVWDTKKYFNIWVIDAIQQNPDNSYVAGYAQFPSSGINNTYGIVCVNQNFQGTDRTLTHEVGHCFNLYHTFQSGCGWSCSNSGDYCCDTPPVTESSFDCDPNRNTCSNDNTGGSPYGGDVLDQWENYMSYASCQNMFTEDQKTRMMAVLNSTSTSTGLAQLSTPGNLSFTGVADPYEQNPVCVPMGANFSYNKTYVCEGDTVKYSDQDTYNATPTMWDWTFEGGSPAVSNQESPAIVYNTEGVYDVTYSPGTSAGFASPVTKSNIITVSSIVADYNLPFDEGFESTTTFNDEWEVINNAPNGWQNTTTASYTGSRSVRVLNINNELNDYTELISPSYDLTNMTEPKLMYKWAFARKSSGGNDQLIVYYSLDCGGTWTITSVQAGASMATGSSTNSSWAPNGTGDWDEKTIDLSALAGNPNVRFKFRLKNNGGNNFYLDDINLDGNIGVQENVVNKFKIYPNPMKESATVSFSLTENVQNLQIVLRDVLGKVVTRVVNGKAFSQGKYTMALDQEDKLTTGLYFLEFNADGKVKTEKLIVQ